MHLFQAVDRFRGNPNADGRKHLLEAAEKKAPAALSLKVGAQVILTRNMPEFGLVNGSRGIVRQFQEADAAGAQGVPRASFECALVDFTSGQSVLVRPQSVFLPGRGKTALVRVALPLKLAWALTVHKSQVRECV